MYTLDIISSKIIIIKKTEYITKLYIYINHGYYIKTKKNIAGRIIYMCVYVCVLVRIEITHICDYFSDNMKHLHGSLVLVHISPY